MPAADNIRSCREPSFLKTEASLNEIIWNGANPPLPQPAHAGSPLREGAIVCKGEKGRQCPAQLRCINMRCAPAGQAHPRETKARRPAQSQAAQPTQKRPGGTAAAATPSRIYAPTRDTGQAPSRTQAAQPTQKRTGGQSRRSSTQRDKRANVRLRALMSASGRTNPTQRESQGPNNPHPAAASRASGSNCGRRCSRTYPV